MATHQITQAKNIPYQPLLIKLVFSVLANAIQAFCFKTSLPVPLMEFATMSFCQVTSGWTIRLGTYTEQRRLTVSTRSPIVW